MKKIGAILLSLLMALVLLPAPAFASVSSLDAMRQELEEKYGINIRYDLDMGGSPIIGTGDLYTLDVGLGAVTAPVVRQVSNYYVQTKGKRLTFYFTNAPDDYDDPQLMTLGVFHNSNVVISLYMPTSQGSFSTGASPLTVVHEFAHALHEMVERYYGASKMEQDWASLNGGVSNNEGYMVYPYNKAVFVSSYAASGYYEDFADTFAHAFVRNKPGQGFYHQLVVGETKTAIAKKIDFITALLPKYFSSCDTAVANIGKAYTTPVAVNYQGYRLSGVDLQFMGCTAPRYVLRGIMDIYGLRVEQSTWISDIGGWQARTSDGQYYLAFPGGTCTRISGPVVAAA